jgi:NTP pyrophosphatase (non-canonical NTP hydrolase)
MATNTPSSGRDERRMYREALARWGPDSQLFMLAEECAELIQAASKYRRRPSMDTQVSMLCEMADVDIMLGQMKVMLNDGGVFDEFRRAKLERLRKMLKEG